MRAATVAEVKESTEYMRTQLDPPAVETAAPAGTTEAPASYDTSGAPTSVIECESGGDPNIHGGSGSYHGAFQFMKSTWQNAPKSVGADPHKQRWKVQAVVAVLLKKRDGAGSHWPVCG